MPLSSIAQTILANVTKAMQDAEEIWGPGESEYVPLMDAIVAECKSRVATFKSWAEVPDTQHGEPWKTAPDSLRHFANALTWRYMDETPGIEDGPQIHAIMARGALSEEFDENTGGWVWLSYSVHVEPVSGVRVFVIAGCDTCAALVLPDADDLSPVECAEMVWDMHGEEESALLSRVYYTAD